MIIQWSSAKNLVYLRPRNCFIPQKYFAVQRSLNSILSAKSHVYTSTFFGKNNFYAEEFDFKKDPIHPLDRRKIRFGLKSIVDFIIQLDVENLKTCLKENDSSIEDYEDCRGKSIGSRFSPDSFLGLMDRTNPTK